MKAIHSEEMGMYHRYLYSNLSKFMSIFMSADSECLKDSIKMFLEDLEATPKEKEFIIPVIEKLIETKGE